MKGGDRGKLQPEGESHTTQTGLCVVATSVGGDELKSSGLAAVQAQHVNYALHTLGWKAFQDLCVAVSTEVLGKPVETFLASRDGGRDGAFIGVAAGIQIDNSMQVYQ